MSVACNTDNRGSLNGIYLFICLFLSASRTVCEIGILKFIVDSDKCEAEEEISLECGEKVKMTEREKSMMSSEGFHSVFSDNIVHCSVDDWLLSKDRICIKAVEYDNEMKVMTERKLSNTMK